MKFNVTRIIHINAEQVYTQFWEYFYLYLRQWKCNHMYAINNVYTSFIYKECKYT